MVGGKNQKFKLEVKESMKQYQKQKCGLEGGRRLLKLKLLFGKTAWRSLLQPTSSFHGCRLAKAHPQWHPLPLQPLARPTIRLTTPPTITDSRQCPPPPPTPLLVFGGEMKNPDSPAVPARQAAAFFNFKISLVPFWPEGSDANLHLNWSLSFILILHQL